MFFLSPALTDDLLIEDEGNNFLSRHYLDSDVPFYSHKKKTFTIC
jgi:hypothetical protein